MWWVEVPIKAKVHSLSSAVARPGGDGQAESRSGMHRKGKGERGKGKKDNTIQWLVRNANRKYLHDSHLTWKVINSMQRASSNHAMIMTSTIRQWCSD